MKRFLSTLLLWVGLLASFAQNRERVEVVIPGYALLFPQYTKGTVLFHSGESAEYDFNYNCVLEEMLFLSEDSSVQKIAKPEDVINITIGKRTFVPSKKSAFYEVIPVDTNKQVYLCAAWRIKLVSQGKKIAYGGYSSSASVETYIIYTGTESSIDMTRPQSDHELFTTRYNNAYYLWDGSEYKKIDSAKTLGKIYKMKKKEIYKFVKENKINFKDLNHVIKALRFCIDDNR